MEKENLRSNPVFLSSAKRPGDELLVFVIWYLIFNKFDISFFLYVAEDLYYLCKII